MKKMYWSKMLGLGLCLTLTVMSMVACRKGTPAVVTENTVTETESKTTGGKGETAEAQDTQETGETKEAVEDWESEPVVLRATIVDYAQVGYFEEAMNRFTEMHPNVTFEPIDILNSEYIEKVTTMMAAGEDIDLIYSKNNPQFMTLASNGQVEDLMPYIERDGVDLSIYNGAAEGLTIDNKLYGLPFRNDLWLLYYNKNLFDKAGVPYPTDDMTWDDWAEMCEKMTSGTGAEKVYGGYLQSWPASVQNMAIQNGKHTVVSDDYGFMKEAYERVLDLQDKGYIMDYSTISTGSLHYTGTFFNQQVATVYQGTWFISYLLDETNAGRLPFEWGLVKAPHTSDGEAGDAVGAAFPMCINSKSENKEAAWQFVKYLTSVECAEIIADYGALPAARTDEVLNIYLSQEGFPAGYESAFDVTKLSFEVPVHEKSGSIGTILDEENSLIMTKSLTIDDALAELKQRVSEALNED